MFHDHEPRRLGYRDIRTRWAVVQSTVGKLLAASAALVAVVGAIALSVLVLAVVVTGMLLVGAYLWWKTRDLRRQMRADMSRAVFGDNIIEGEIIDGEIVRDDGRKDGDKE